MTAPYVRLFVRYGLQAALVLAPLLTMGFSLLNLIGHSAAGPTDPVQVLFLSGPKQEVELQLRVLITVAALACTLMFEAVDLYLPSRSLLRFRKHYLEEQNKEWRSKLIDDVRINIMYARRRWYFLWLFVKAFDWTYVDSRQTPRDNQMEQTMRQTVATNVSEPTPASCGQIREVPVKPEVWKRTAAQELSDPPKFPALK